MKIEVSNGEIMDKYSILSIKLEKLDPSEKGKMKNVAKEHGTMKSSVNQIFDSCEARELLESLYSSLMEVNVSLWNIEDEIRECERNKEFGEKFIDLARAVYFTNDDRSKIKKKINMITGSDLIEEKSYKEYK